MNKINNVTVEGAFGKDAEIRSFGNGRSVITLSLAFTESYKNSQGEVVENTHWLQVVNKGVSDAAVAYATRYYLKGQKAVVSGRLMTNSWKDSEGHQKHQTYIDVSGAAGCISLQVAELKGKAKSDSQPAQTNSQSRQPAPASVGGYDFDQ